jgi:hypothetical protein
VNRIETWENIRNDTITMATKNMLMIGWRRRFVERTESEWNMEVSDDR